MEKFYRLEGSFIFLLEVKKSCRVVVCILVLVKVYIDLEIILDFIENIFLLLYRFLIIKIRMMILL